MRGNPASAALGVLTLVVSLLLLAGCGGGQQGGRSGTDGLSLTVMSWNLFIGADITSLATVTTPSELEDAVERIFADVVASDFPERAETIADQIEEFEPDLIGLQEAALWRTQEPPDGEASPATSVALDFVEILLGALSERGLSYEAVAAFVGPDVEATGGSFDIRLTDRNVILARTDSQPNRLLVENARADRFPTDIILPSPLGETITLERGWASVDVTVGDATVRFVTTHLEVPLFSDVQEAQAEELIEAAGAGTELPVLYVGDFNSRADGTGTATYTNLIEAELTDVWSTVAIDDPGFTCCHDPDLRNPEPGLDERIDFVLIDGEARVREVDNLGDVTSDRTPSGLWPSDHGGVVASLLVFD